MDQGECAAALRDGDVKRIRVEQCGRAHRIFDFHLWRLVILTSRIPFIEKKMGQEIPADTLGDEWKGYVFRITGGNGESFSLL